MDHGAQAQAIAKQGIVLLKHEGDLLPLSTTNLRSITVIGPDADNVSAAGGGSAAVKPAYAVSVLDALRQRTGDGVRVAYAPGADPIGPGVLLPGLPAIPAAYFSPPVGGEGAAGVRAAYWSNLDFSGEPDLVRQEPRIELHQNLFEIIPGPKVASPKLPPAPVEEGVHGRLSARWTGTLTAPVSGEYTLSLTVQGTARLRLNEELILDSTTAALASSSNPRVPPGSAPAEWPACALKVYLTTVRLTAGRPNAVQVEYAADAREVWPMPQAMLRLGWQPPADVVTPEMETAADLARQSDVALVVVRTKATPDELGRPAVTGYTDRIRQETPWLGNIYRGNDRQRGG